MAPRYIQMYIPPGTRKESKKRTYTHIHTERLLDRSRSRSKVQEMRSHRESISLIKGETGTGAPVARADTRARIQRRRKFMPVPYRRRRQAYDVPSTVSPRRIYSPISLRLPFSLPTLPPCLVARSPERRSFLPICGRRAAF